MAGQSKIMTIVPPALLMIGTLAGLALANGPLAGLYNKVLDTHLSFGVGALSIIDKPFLLLVNDGLMAIFFLFVGLELKREILIGELSGLKKSTLPIFAAIGGMLCPALIYNIFNPTPPSSSGWGIPMATDIAFALGALTLLGNRVPLALKVFLAAIAIIDDLGAILVIALFYTSELSINSLVISLMLYGVAIIFNKTGVKRTSVYMLLGIPLWYFMLKSGVHATIAGVLLATCVPLSKSGTSKSDLEDILNKHRSLLDSPAIYLEKSLLPWVTLLIVPLFAFANSGINLSQGSFGSASIGIILGLTLGKPIGIFLGCWIACKLKLGALAEQVTWKHIWGIGSLAGIGFTMSLFVNSLAFSDVMLRDQGKLAVIIASVISCLIGITLLWGRRQDSLAKVIKNSGAPT